MKSAEVIGLTDKVFLKPSDTNEAGHAFFYEIDSKLPKRTGNFLRIISKLFRTRFHVLKTKAGYHFISFQIFPCDEYLLLWVLFTEELGDKSDYNHNIANKILRLSAKGKSPPPSYFMAFGDEQGKISSWHADQYIRTEIIPADAIQGKRKKTFGKLTIYKSRKRI